MSSNFLFLIMLIFLKLYLFDVITIYSTENVPLWTWECVGEKCVPKKIWSSDKVQSLTTCNMLCSSIFLWPQPTGSVSLLTSVVPVRADLFQLQIKSSSSQAVQEHLLSAFSLFVTDLRKLENSSFGFEEWHSVAVQVTIPKTGSPDPRMLLKTDESYNLTINPKRNSLVAEIISNSFCGARHALETLSQLIWFDQYTSSLIMLNIANIEDAPRFRYRGLMVDTAHNYFPVSDILRTIDGMAANKLNTLHWRATDSQAFPLLLNSIPQVAEYGAYSSNVYKTNDIKKIVQRAKIRGIRVLLEVYIPAHIGSTWNCTELDKSIRCTDNPQNPGVFDVLESMHREILMLTEVDDIYHLGGDYDSSRNWLEALNDSNPTAVWFRFLRKALKCLASVHGTLPELTLLWSSNLSERVKIDLEEYVSNIGLQVNSVGWAEQYLSGLRTVISHVDAWDLNSGFGTWYQVSNGAPYNSWQRMYEYRPWPIGSECVEGGEATVWSYMLSPGGLDGRVWPRAAAFAERLWSDRPEAATKTIEARLDIHRTRLLTRGIQASPLWSMWCTHNPFTCD